MRKPQKENLNGFLPPQNVGKIPTVQVTKRLNYFPPAPLNYSQPLLTHSETELVLLISKGIVDHVLSSQDVEAIIHRSSTAAA